MPSHADIQLDATPSINMEDAPPTDMHEDAPSMDMHEDAPSIEPVSPSSGLRVDIDSDKDNNNNTMSTTEDDDRLSSLPFNRPLAIRTTSHLAAKANIQTFAVDLRSSRRSPREQRKAYIGMALPLVLSALEDMDHAVVALSKKGGFFAGMAQAGRMALNKSSLKKGGPSFTDALKTVHYNAVVTAAECVELALSRYNAAKEMVVVLPEIHPLSSHHAKAHHSSSHHHSCAQPGSPRAQRFTQRTFGKEVEAVREEMKVALGLLREMENVY